MKLEAPPIVTHERVFSVRIGDKSYTYIKKLQAREEEKSGYRPTVGKVLGRLVARVCRKETADES